MKKFIKPFFIILGPLCFVLLELIGPPKSMSTEAFHVLCTTVWIAIWWMTEAIPIAVTALLPIIIFPLSEAVSISATTASYGHKYIFLYLGGFILAITIEKWGLHKRIALHIIKLIGSNITTIILGFMAATAFMSMWISNTATSVMMLPIGMAVVSQFKKHNNGFEADAENMGKALMLAIAYSASIGGFATLIGTPPNLVLAGILEETYGVKVSFFQWMSFGFPLSVLLLLICWKYLTKAAFKFEQKEFPGGSVQINNMLKELGRISYEERLVLLIFIVTAVLWMTRSLIQQIIPTIDDTIIGMMAGVVLFMIPAKDTNKRLINWQECSKLPWNIILLFGGGMALAKGFSETGLAEWIALQMTLLQGVSLILLILVLVASVNFLTEITSNLATTAMLLPVLAPMALAFDLHPYMIMVSVTISASCAFMLPAATPPNAVVFGSGYLRIPDMIKSGIWMNLISIILITVLTYLLLPLIWDIDPNTFPTTFNLLKK
ncbi:MAG: sodium-dependent dicarboxylate transporter 2/3/5 [Saprospiraceae bacterium]|jgi:sodium-dependent dicarboxylate transporter 2/3/5